MTGRQFYDWQTAGGGGDVLLLVQALELHEISWCVIEGLAVNHWAEEPIATAAVVLVIATGEIDRAVRALQDVGFSSNKFEWSINLTGHSKVRVQINTEPVYQSFLGRAVPSDVHGILMRVATLEDTLHGKLLAWRDSGLRPSKRQKDLLDITRLVEAHPELDHLLPPDIAERLGQ